jgi:hypothetical protein
MQFMNFCKSALIRYTLQIKDGPEAEMCQSARLLIELTKILLLMRYK